MAIRAFDSGNGFINNEGWSDEMMELGCQFFEGMLEGIKELRERYKKEREERELSEPPTDIKEAPKSLEVPREKTLSHRAAEVFDKMSVKEKDMGSNLFDAASMTESIEPGETEVDSGLFLENEFGESKNRHEHQIDMKEAAEIGQLSVEKTNFHQATELFDEMPDTLGRSVYSNYLRTLVVTVHDTSYPVTTEVLHQVFDGYGLVDEINILPTGGSFQALVRYTFIENSLAAMYSLHNRCIYEGCCWLDIKRLSYAMLEEMLGKFNSIERIQLEIKRKLKWMYAAVEKFEFPCKLEPPPIDNSTPSIILRESSMDIGVLRSNDVGLSGRNDFTQQNRVFHDKIPHKKMEILLKEQSEEGLKNNSENYRGAKIQKARTKNETLGIDFVAGSLGKGKIYQKVAGCNRVVQIRKDLKCFRVSVAENDIVEGKESLQCNYHDVITAFAIEPGGKRVDSFKEPQWSTLNAQSWLQVERGKHSKVKSSTLECVSDYEKSYGENVSYRVDKSVKNENLLAKYYTVALGSADWDDLVYESKKNEAPLYHVKGIGYEIEVFTRKEGPVRAIWRKLGVPLSVIATYEKLKSRLNWLPLGLRVWWHIKEEAGKGTPLKMDSYHKQIIICYHGVPFVGIWARSIGRSLRGEFQRFQFFPRICDNELLTCQDTSCSYVTAEVIGNEEYDTKVDFLSFALILQEILEDTISPAIDEALRLQPRSSKKVERDSDLISFMTELVVPTSRVGCLIGKRRFIIAKLRKVTKADIRTFSKENLPKIAYENDEMVQISGDLDIAKDALVQVTSRLRANLFEKEGAISDFLPIPPYFPMSPDDPESVKYESRNERSHGNLHFAPSQFFMILGAISDGFMSSKEYQLSIRLLSIQESSFSVALKMFDIDSNNEIDSEGFKKVMTSKRAHNSQGAVCINGAAHKLVGSLEDEGLLEYFFGKGGKQPLQHGKFVIFLKNLHDEMMKPGFEIIKPKDGSIIIEHGGWNCNLKERNLRNGQKCPEVPLPPPEPPPIDLRLYN